MEFNSTWARKLLDSHVDAVVIISEKGEIVYWNPKAEDIFGYSAEEAIGKGLELITPWPISATHQKYVDEYLKNKETSVIGISRETIAKKKSGHIFSINLSVSEIVDANNQYFVGAMRDISHEKAEEKRLMESETKYRTLMEILPVGVFQTDLEGNIVYVNRTWMKMSGIDLSQAMNDWTVCIKSHDVERVFNEWREFVVKKEPMGKFEFQFNTGIRVISIVSIFPDSYDKNEKVGYIGVTVDLSHSHSVESEINNLLSELRNGLDSIRNMRLERARHG